MEPSHQPSPSDFWKLIEFPGKIAPLDPAQRESGKWRALLPTDALYYERARKKASGFHCDALRATARRAVGFVNVEPPCTARWRNIAIALTMRSNLRRLFSAIDFRIARYSHLTAESLFAEADTADTDLVHGRAVELQRTILSFEGSKTLEFSAG
jgi:hypothetical protein